MAIDIGETALATDFSAFQTSIINFYKTVKGSNPPLTTVAIGDTITAADINALISAYTTALAGWHTVANSGYNSSRLGSGARYNVRSGG